MNLEASYDRYAKHLYRHALALTKHRAAAEDALKSVFVKLLGRLREGTEIRDRKAYLHTAIRREALRLIERRRRDVLCRARQPPRRSAFRARGRARDLSWHFLG